MSSNNSNCNNRNHTCRTRSLSNDAFSLLLIDDSASLCSLGKLHQLEQLLHFEGPLTALLPVIASYGLQEAQP